jgi:hypothetical protein
MIESSPEPALSEIEDFEDSIQKSLGQIQGLLKAQRRLDETVDYNSRGSVKSN